MKIIGISAFKDNYIWAIVDEVERTAICVDPGDAAPVLSFLEQNNLTLCLILLTHHHSDHIGGTQVLCQNFPGTIVYGPQDPRITETHIVVSAGDIIALKKHTFRIFSIPGHTSSHVCYYEPQYGWLFPGDTLFSAGCGRVFDGTHEQLFHSLQQLKSLPDTTLIYCGHEYTLQNLRFAETVEPENKAISLHKNHVLQSKTGSLPSNIRLEKEINPFFRTDTLSLQHYAREHGLNTQDPFAIFKLLRDQKDFFC